MIDVIFNRQAVLEAAGEGHFIGIFQFSAEGDASGDGGDADTGVGEFFLYIIDSSVALDIGAEGEDQFFCLFFCYAVQEGFDVQLIRAYAIQWGDDTAEYMVHTVKLLGGFDGHYLSERFHYADEGLFSAGIGTDGAAVCIGHIVAFLAESNLVAHTGDGFAEEADRFFFLFQEVQNEAESGFATDTGQFREFVHGCFHQLGGEDHVAKLGLIFELFEVDFYLIFPVRAYAEVIFPRDNDFRLSLQFVIARIPFSVAVAIVQNPDLVVGRHQEWDVDAGSVQWDGLFEHIVGKE